MSAIEISFPLVTTSIPDYYPGTITWSIGVMEYKRSQYSTTPILQLSCCLGLANLLRPMLDEHRFRRESQDIQIQIFPPFVEFCDVLNRDVKVLAQKFS